MNLATHAAAAFAVVAAVGFQSAPRPKPDCGASFAGFDSRAQVELIARLPISSAYPVGLEVTPSGPVVASRSMLFGVVGTDQLVTIPFEQAVSAIAVDADDRLVLQTDRGIVAVTRAGPQPLKAWGDGVHGVVVNSGQRQFIEAISADGVTRFVARTPESAATFGLAEIDGVFRAASWDASGLTAVVGTKLIRWTQGTNTLERIASDEGLKEASGVCTLGLDRTVVTLRTSTLLFTRTSMVVIAAVGGLCRVRDGHLYVFDGRLQRLWRLNDLSRLGDPEKDLARAKELVVLSVTQDRPFRETPEFGEAVRLVGCAKATEMATTLEK